MNFLKQCIANSILLILFISCDSIYENQNPEFPVLNTVKLKNTGSKIFTLDSVTAPSPKSLQLYTDKNGKRFFTFLNGFNNSIYLYDFDSLNLLNVIKYAVEGDNGVGRMMGYHIQSFDSIFTYCYETSTLSVTDSSAQLLDYVSSVRRMGNAIQKYTPTPKLANGMPFIKEGDSVFLVGNTGGEYFDENNLNRPIQCSINLVTGEVKFNGKYPDIYRKANWAGQLYRYVYQTYNSEKKIIIRSFPADHNIYVQDLRNNTDTSFYASFNKIGSIKSYPKAKYQLHDKDDYFMHYSTNPAYHSIFYDKYRDVYLRVFNLPIKDYDRHVREKTFKVWGVIILNNRFEVIGQHEFPKFSHEPMEMFFTKEGIYIRHYTENENELVFNEFEIVDL